MTVYERIKKRRKQLNISAEDMANALGVSRATYYRYESAEVEKMPTTVLEPLSRMLKCSPAYLMGWDDPFSESSAVLHAKMAKDTYFQRLYIYWERLSDAGKDKLVEYATDLSKIYSADTVANISRVAEEPVYYVDAAHAREDLHVTPEMKKHDDDIMDDENF